MFYSFSRVGLRFNIFIKNKHNGLAEMKVCCLNLFLPCKHEYFCKKTNDVLK